MAYIMEMKVGKYVYLYEAKSYRNNEGKPRSTKILIGKVDSLTGERVYKPEYLAKKAAAGTPIEVQPRKIPLSFTEGDIRNSFVKEYGAYYFLEAIADLIGLKSTLKKSVPEHWMELLTLAIYLICTEDPLMYCNHWIESTETLPVSNLTSQRISDLLHKVTDSERSAFFTNWLLHRTEQEYLALDITSISSWSELIDDVEWGYNRDHEQLPQINLCMLMGESSKLPVFQTVYGGSLKDVSTLDTTLKHIISRTEGNKPILIVMDKGFYSKKNVDTLLKDGDKYRFIIPIPFSVQFAKDQVTGERENIDRVTNIIVSGKNSVRGVTKVCEWMKEKKKLFVHVYYNPLKAVKQKEELYSYVSQLASLAEEDRKKKKHQKEFKKYLNIRKSLTSSRGYTVKIREDVLEKELETSGWLVMVSSHVADCKEALSIYRAKDVVEKGFMRLKNSIDLGRLRIHSQNSLQNKVFVGFLSLVLLAHMNKVMLYKELYEDMTLKEMLLILKKLRIQYINGHRILFPVTKEQKRILEAFSIPEPV
jgi:transposase